MAAIRFVGAVLSFLSIYTTCFASEDLLSSLGVSAICAQSCLAGSLTSDDRQGSPFDEVCSSNSDVNKCMDGCGGGYAKMFVEVAGSSSEYVCSVKKKAFADAKKCLNDRGLRMASTCASQCNLTPAIRTLMNGRTHEGVVKVAGEACVAIHCMVDCLPEPVDGACPATLIENGPGTLLSNALIQPIKKSTKLLGQFPEEAKNRFYSVIPKSCEKMFRAYQE